MRQVKLFDSTLRDGSHALKQQLLPQHITEYCHEVDAAGLHTVIVGHGNGIGASSILMTRSAMDELEMVSLTRENLKQTKLGTFVTVGFGTIEEHIKPSMKIGVDVFCIASHCTEADTMKKHIEYISQRGKEVYGVLMNTHLVEPNILVKEAQKIQSYGADGVILMDSAGAFTPEHVENVIKPLCDQLSIEVGFHPHNNLSMGVSNAYTAVKCGARIIDGTVRGFGAGAGNCQIDALVALLEKEGIETDVDLYKLLDAGEKVIKRIMGYNSGIDGTSIVSGYAGVVSTFKPQVERVATEYGVDPRDIFCELGKRKAISGQDDLILEVAKELCKKQR